MKKLLLTALALLMAASLFACKSPDPSGAPAESGTDPSFNSDSVQPSVILTFRGSKLETSVQDSGISVSGNSFVITRGGCYELRGDLSDGQIKVAVGKESDVELIFNNFTASCNSSAPLYVESANKAVIYLAAGTVNTLTDAAQYQFPSPAEDKPNACIYSADDLTIKGTGTLNVNGSYNNGIGCKNDLRIKDCTLKVTAPNNILKGNDSVEIESAKVTLSGGEDAIKSDTTDRADKGYVLIAAGSQVSINCTDDAIQSTMSITVEPGTSVTGTCGGSSLNCPGVINADGDAMQIGE